VKRNRREAQYLVSEEIIEKSRRKHRTQREERRLETRRALIGGGESGAQRRRHRRGLMAAKPKAEKKKKKETLAGGYTCAAAALSWKPNRNEEEWNGRNGQYSEAWRNEEKRKWESLNERNEKIIVENEEEKIKLNLYWSVWRNVREMSVHQRGREAKSVSEI